MKCVIPTMKDGSRDWKCDLETENKDGVCDSCKEFGWTVDPEEIRKAVLDDPVLGKSIGHESPYQPPTP